MTADTTARSGDRTAADGRETVSMVRPRSSRGGSAVGAPLRSGASGLRAPHRSRAFRGAGKVNGLLRIPPQR